MAKTATRIRHQADQPHVTRRSRVVMYPDVSYDVDPLPTPLIEKITNILRDENNISCWRKRMDWAYQSYIKSPSDNPDRFLRVLRGIKRNVELRTAADLDDREDLIPSHSLSCRYATFQQHELSCVLNRICKILLPFEKPERVQASLFSHLEISLHNDWLMTPRVSYQTAYNAIIDPTRRRGWIETRYAQAAELRHLHLVAHITGDDIFKAKIHLIAIDNLTREKIEAGEYDGISASEMQKIGNYVRQESYRTIWSSAIAWRLGASETSARSLLQTSIKDPLEIARAKLYYKVSPFKGASIDDDDIVRSTGNAEELIQLLDRYAREFPGKPIGRLAYTAFSRLADRLMTAQSSAKATLNSDDIQLPDRPPEEYQGLRGPEAPPDFVKRVYGEWLGKGLTRADIRKLDPKLAIAINNWLSRPDNEWPSDVDLPTLKKQNDRAIEQLHEGEPTNLTLREARRLEGAIQRRRRREKE